MGLTGIRPLGFARASDAGIYNVGEADPCGRSVCHRVETGWKQTIIARSLDYPVIFAAIC